MEHSLPSLELTRPWRRATIVASAVAVLELALIVVLLVALVGRPVAEKLEQQAAAAPAPAAPAPGPRVAGKPAAAPLLPRAETAVLVLNGNGRAGAAGAAGSLLKGRGYVVAGVGNAPRTDYRRTYVMYRPGKQREAQRLAQDLGRGVVAPLDGIKAADLMGAHVALVLGP